MPPEVVQACDSCRSRKVKCSKSTPTCRQCALSKKPCHYSPRPTRSPLTRSYLTMVENRMQQLERALQKLVPGGCFLSIDEILNISSSYQQPSPIPSSKPKKASSSSVSSISSSSSAHSILSSGSFPISSYSSSSSVDSLTHIYSSSPKTAELTDLYSIFDCASSQKLSLVTEEISPSFVLSNENISDLSGTPSSSNNDLANAFDATVLDAVSLFSMAQLFARDNIDSPLSFESPANNPLTSDEELFLVQAYFEEIHGILPIIPDTFMSQYKSGARQGSWSGLVNIVLALGAWSKQAENLDIYYFDAAKECLSQDDTDSGSLERIAALALISLFSHMKFWHTSASDFLERAVKMAISSQTHCEPATKDAFYIIRSELSRRLWWGLVSLDYAYVQFYGQRTLLPRDLNTDIGEIRTIEWDILKSGLPLGDYECSNQHSIYSGLIMISRFYKQFRQSIDAVSSSSFSASKAYQLCQSVNLFFEQEMSSAGSEGLASQTPRQTRLMFSYSCKAFGFQIMATQRVLIERIAQILSAQKLVGEVSPLVPLTASEIRCLQLCLVRSIQSLKNIKKFVDSRGALLSLLDSREVLNAIYATCHVPLLFYAYYDCLIDDIQSDSFKFTVPSQNTMKDLIASVIDMLRVVSPSHACAISPVLRLFETALDQPISFLSKIENLMSAKNSEALQNYDIADSLYGSSFGLFEADEMITGEETMERFPALLTESIFTN